MKYQIMNTEITRSSHRIYTHAIIRKGQVKGKALSFCGSLALAQKSLRSYLNMYEVRELKIELEIVEVVVVK